MQMAVVDCAQADIAHHAVQEARASAARRCVDVQRFRRCRPVRVQKTAALVPALLAVQPDRTGTIGLTDVDVMRNAVQSILKVVERAELQGRHMFRAPGHPNADVMGSREKTFATYLGGTTSLLP